MIESCTLSRILGAMFYVVNIITFGNIALWCCHIGQRAAGMLISRVSLISLLVVTLTNNGSNRQVLLCSSRPSGDVHK